MTSTRNVQIPLFILAEQQKGDERGDGIEIVAHQGRRITPLSGIIVVPFLKLINPVLLMKPLRQTTTRPIISYKPRVEPLPPVHAKRVEGYTDVYQIRGQYMAFVLQGDSFKQSPVFTQPASAQRWANQTRQDSDD